MKKIIFLASIFSILFLSLFFAKPVEAVFMKVTVTITSMTIPQRAVMMEPALPANTEFMAEEQCSFEILNPQGQVIRSFNDGGSSCRKGKSATLVFEHTGGNFTPRINVLTSTTVLQPYGQNGSQYANCQPSPGTGYKIRVCQLTRFADYSKCSTSWGDPLDMCPKPPSTANFGALNTLYIGDSPNMYFNLAPITL